ncbi:hypothetical protein EDB80DRAFT_784362 [Ilyonectria destructans]|nr:hypothetical protein EDB80DRAFT_784362 [Ilyonectria destructans]
MEASKPTPSDLEIASQAAPSIPASIDPRVALIVSGVGTRTAPGADAVLNFLFRMADSSTTFTEIYDPVQTAPFQRDHFIEVQHIVTIFQRRWPHTGNWLVEPQWKCWELALMVSNIGNLFQINGDDNVAKSNIKWSQYPNHDPFLAKYINWTVDSDGTRVEDCLRKLLQHWTSRPNEPQYEFVTYVAKSIMQDFECVIVSFCSRRYSWVLYISYIICSKVSIEGSYYYFNNKNINLLDI